MTEPVGPESAWDTAAKDEVAADICALEKVELEGHARNKLAYLL